MIIENQFTRNIGIYTNEENNKITNTKIGIIGLGCTGSMVAEFLARVGIEKFILVDGDHYEITNVNRQINAVYSTLGKNKASVTAKRLLDINNKCEIKHLPKYLTYKNAESILRDCDFVVNGLDDPYSMILLHRTARKLKKDSIFLLSGVVPFQGIISILEYNNPIDYETFMSIPTKGLNISKSTKILKKELFEKITKGRLENALKRGAIQGKWAEIRRKGGPMISNGITSNIVALIAANEIIKAIIKRATLKYVSAPEILLYDGAKNTLKIRKPKSGNYWFQGDF